MKKFLGSLIVAVACILLAGCNITSESSSKTVTQLKALAPGGAPALAQAYIENSGVISDKYSYSVDRVGDTTLLQAGFQKGEYDIIFAPINLGVKFYNNNQKYKMLASVTWGNLYIATCNENFTLEDLNNNELVAFGEGSINQVILNNVLQSNSITPSTITYLAATSDTKNYLVANPQSYCLVAEPVLSAATVALKGQNKTVSTISIQDLWAEKHENESYVQAAVFLKSELCENNELVNDVYNALETSVNYCNSDIEGVSEIASRLEYGLPGGNVLKLAIPNSNIKLVKAKDSSSVVRNVMSLMGVTEINEEFFAF